MLAQPIGIAREAELIWLRLNAWAQPKGGEVKVMANKRHLWEEIYAQKNAPRCLICFDGERHRQGGPEAPTNRVDRRWIVVVIRGHGFKNEMAEAVGNNQAFYTDLETIRDLLRTIVNISDEFPVNYTAMNPLPNVAQGNAANVFLDAYEILFDTANDIGAVSLEAPEPVPEPPETILSVKFVLQPITVILGQRFPVTVQLIDQNGDDVAQAGVAIGLSFTSNWMGELLGTVSVMTDASGLASFPDLTSDVVSLKVLQAVVNENTADSNQFGVNTNEVTPNIHAATPIVSWGTFVAGNFRVEYVNGAMIFTTPGAGWQIFVGAANHGPKIVHSNSTEINAPGDAVVYGNQSACEAGNAGASVTFTHTGGTIHMYLFDSPYTDNQNGNPNPTFKLVPIYS